MANITNVLPQFAGKPYSKVQAVLRAHGLIEFGNLIGQTGRAGGDRPINAGYESFYVSTGQYHRKFLIDVAGDHHLYFDIDGDTITQSYVAVYDSTWLESKVTDTPWFKAILTTVVIGLLTAGIGNSIAAAGGAEAGASAGAATGAETGAVVSGGLTSAQVTAVSVNTVASGSSAITGDSTFKVVGSAINYYNGNFADANNFATEGAPVGDYTNAFDSFDYSSGESLTAFSDAANVDYGFGAIAPFESASVFDAGTSAVIGGDISPYAYNATAESAVSDFGTLSEGTTFSSSDVTKWATTISKGVGVALEVNKAVAANQSKGGALSGGGQKYAQTSGSPLNKAASNSQGSSPILDGINGIISQVESVLPKSYTGQLGANKASPSPGASNVVLIAGAALIVVYFAVRKG